MNKLIALFTSVLSFIGFQKAKITDQAKAIADAQNANTALQGQVNALQDAVTNLNAKLGTEDEEINRLIGRAKLAEVEAQRAKEDAVNSIETALAGNTTLNLLQEKLVSEVNANPDVPNIHAETLGILASGTENPTPSIEVGDSVGVFDSGVVRVGVAGAVGNASDAGDEKAQSTQYGKEVVNPTADDLTVADKTPGEAPGKDA